MDQPVTALNGPEVAQTLEANRSPGTVAGGQYTKAIICAVTLLAVDCVAALAAAFVASNCITPLLLSVLWQPGSLLSSRGGWLISADNHLLGVKGPLYGTHAILV
jgi:hypothetical protein